jgi:benzoate membrane transport protein
LGTAFLGAHTSNLAAISAALCTGPEAHPDPAQRWKAEVFYALWWGLIALFGALPPALLATVAGTALLGSMAGAMGTALAADKERFAAAGTLAVTASGITLMGVGSAFWGALLRPSGAGRGTRAAPLTQTCVAAGTRHGQARFDLMGRPS